MSTTARHLAPHRWAGQILDDFAWMGDAWRPVTPRHRKPVHLAPVSGWRAEVEEHAESCPAGDDCPMLDRFTTAGLRRAHLAAETLAVAA